MNPKLAQAFADLKTEPAAADPVEATTDEPEAAAADDGDQVEAKDSRTADEPADEAGQSDEGEQGEDAPEQVEAEADDKPAGDKTESRGERRIRRLAAKKKKLEQDNQELADKVAALESRIEKLLTGEAGKSDDKTDWQDKFTAADADDGKGDDADPAVAELQEQVRQLAIGREREVIRTELAAVAKDHPSVPQKVLLKAIETNPKVDLFDVAEGWERLMGAKPAAAPDAEAEPAKTEAPKSKAKRPPKSKGVTKSATNGRNKYAGLKTAREIFDAYKTGLRS